MGRVGTPTRIDVGGAKTYWNQVKGARERHREYEQSREIKDLLRQIMAREFKEAPPPGYVEVSEGVFRKIRHAR